MPLIRNVKSLSAADTESAGRALAAQLLGDASLPRFVALFGDLGVGKTAFVRGFTSLVAPSARVKSPTFALVNQYVGAALSVFHFDMYRIESEEDLYSIGFYDYLDAGVCLVEWSENIVDYLPDSYLKVEIAKNDPQNTESRSISISLES